MLPAIMPWPLFGLGLPLRNAAPTVYPRPPKSLRRTVPALVYVYLFPMLLIFIGCYIEHQDEYFHIQEGKANAGCGHDLQQS